MLCLEIFVTMLFLFFNSLFSICLFSLPFFYTFPDFVLIRQFLIFHFTFSNVFRTISFFIKFFLSALRVTKCIFLYYSIESYYLVNIVPVHFSVTASPSQHVTHIPHLLADLICVRSQQRSPSCCTRHLCPYHHVSYCREH